jgi:hypothetical protein
MRLEALPEPWYGVYAEAKHAGKYEQIVLAC